MLIGTNGEYGPYARAVVVAPTVYPHVSLQHGSKLFVDAINSIFTETDSYI